MILLFQGKILTFSLVKYGNSRFQYEQQMWAIWAWNDHFIPLCVRERSNVSLKG